MAWTRIDLDRIFPFAIVYSDTPSEDTAIWQSSRRPPRILMANFSVANILAHTLNQWLPHFCYLLWTTKLYLDRIKPRSTHSESRSSVLVIPTYASKNTDGVHEETASVRKFVSGLAAIWKGKWCFELRKSCRPSDISFLSLGKKAIFVRLMT